MQKNKLLILVTVLISIMIFSMAAVCNQCSISPSATSETGEEESTGDKGADTSKTDDSKNTDAAESSSDTEQDDPDSSETQGPNSSPVIEEIYVASAEESAVFFDAMNPAIQEGILQGLYLGMGSLKFTVTASDKNNDKLIFKAFESGDTPIDVDILSDLEAEFIWEPSETGPVAVKIVVEDDRGGKAEYDINMTVLTEEEMEALSGSADEDSGDASSEGVTSIGANPEISGYIVKDTEIRTASSSAGTPYIMIGDNADKKQIKGYLSFDISRLHGKTVLGAWLNFAGFEIINNPRFADFIDVKVYNYEGSLDMADFAVGGQSIARIPTSSDSYVISGDTLKTELQKYLDAATETYFPVKLGLSSSTNNDSVTDVFNIYLSNVGLEIDYTD